VVGRRPGGRRTRALAAAVGVAGAAMAFAASATPATAPSDGAPDCWFQTNGPSVDPDHGDPYTSPLTESDDHGHLFQIVASPQAGFPVKVRVHDAESKHFFEPDTEDADEVLNQRDPTRFTLEGPTGIVLATQTFDPNPPTASPDGSIFEATITAPGTYLLTSETGALPIWGDPAPGLNNDQNAFRIEVTPDGQDLPEPGHEVRIEFTKATITCAENAANLRLAYTVPEGAEMTRLRNFDLEVGGDRVTEPLTYTSPADVETFGTMSGEDVWSENVFPVGVGQHGEWTIELGGLGINNQVAFEANADGVQLPLSVVSLNQPPQWLTTDPVPVDEPIGFEPDPALRSIQLELNEPDDGQTLRFSVPDGGDCEAWPPHRFERFVAPGDMMSVPGENERATLKLAVGARDAGTHCVRVRVFDGGAARDVELEVTVEEKNSAPIARAGPDRVVHEPRTRVRLNGGASFDPDGHSLTLRWAQVRGRAVTRPRTGRLLRFRAPRGKYTFRLIANDGELNSRKDLVVVRVRNGAPIVKAPARRTVRVGRRARIRLGSFVDPGRDGPWRVRINWGDRTKATARKVRRPGGLGKAGHKFLRRGVFTVKVRVTDGDGATGVARFKVTVRRR
jgi:hypothetical protein